jgi:plastocyanin
VLLALSTGHKLGLAIAGGIFVLFAAASAVLIPRYRPDFPGRRGLTPFIVLTVFVFLGMLFAVEVFGAEEEEKPESGEAAESGPAGGTTSAGAAQTVRVQEVDFKIELPDTSYSPGSYVFDLKNDGKTPHNLTIDGPGVSDAATPTIAAGKTAKLQVALQSGTYELYCSVPGHKEAGMDLKITVS